ncbi:uncharacterized protein L969DRAFT_322232 [Mixia osmundae IAM 14324]|uniref:uncharacterized protein n=1 Tax=Mixia osmundae (strain CBS 9802 / IAM 14324 / JCM 22182 / KY 12970) TaxID=764103 RepID=UPI0004A54A7A|nr:uncharacterized protein L969DRAFT_322232 [Mixia osmundae IAM 14324]KEI41673.1 hypothetical protein L969DRAFT_322232 [Mixia osmundae IAM 14324]
MNRVDRWYRSWDCCYSAVPTCWQIDFNGYEGPYKATSFVASGLGSPSDCSDTYCRCPKGTASCVQAARSKVALNVQSQPHYSQNIRSGMC